MLSRKSLYFLSPGVIDIREEQINAPQQGQVRVRSVLSAISSGTEMLFYRGQFPEDLPVDETIGALQTSKTYPLKYGYCSVGEVIEIGDGVDGHWLGKKVFAFNPHESHFNLDVDTLHIVPEGISPQEAVFFPQMETAINFILDGSPSLGEKVVVLGQGVIGLLTTALLAKFPLHELLTFEHYPLRRQASIDFGASASLDVDQVGNHYIDPQNKDSDRVKTGFDLVYELTGVPAALNQAISLTGFHGRIVVGSWYGKKEARINFGGWFHRSRIRLISSQVSSLNPEYSGRWDKARRYAEAWRMISQVKPSKLITHSIPFENADEAYRLLDQNPGETIQVVLQY